MPFVALKGRKKKPTLSSPKSLCAVVFCLIRVDHNEAPLALGDVSQHPKFSFSLLQNKVNQRFTAPCLHLSATTVPTNYFSRGERIKKKKKTGPEKENKTSQWVTAVYKSGAQELDAGFVAFGWTLLLPLWGKRRGTVGELQPRQSCEAAHLSPASHGALEPGAEKVEG